MEASLSTVSRSAAVSSTVPLSQSVLQSQGEELCRAGSQHTALSEADQNVYGTWVSMVIIISNNNLTEQGGIVVTIRY
jgi:hypothetical protein